MLSPQDCKPKVSQVRRSWYVPPPLVSGGGSPGLVSFGFLYTLRGLSAFLLLKRGGQQVASIYDAAMPKRANASLARVPVTGVDPFESMESRRRRILPPCVQPTSPLLPSSIATDRVSDVTSLARTSHTSVRIPNRNDAPVLHTSRRGSRRETLSGYIRECAASLGSRVFTG